MTTAIAVQNPYWDAVQKVQREHDWLWADQINPASRRDLVLEYAWAIPTTNAVAMLLPYGPFVEIGAGTGYWAWMLAQMGADVVAYDEAPPSLGINSYGHKREWFPVQFGGPHMARRHSDRTLLLCWPPYAGAMALSALRAYRGSALVYIGEGPDGCTGCEKFHATLQRRWELVESIDIPQWAGMHDRIHVYRRAVRG